jgi:4-hydroxybenzoate polyprenyltransferase
MLVSKIPRISEKLSAWVALSRLPFHSVGVLPFILGGVLAWRLGGTFHWDVFAWGTVGVVLVMLAIYYANEYWDVVEDALSARLGPSRFARGHRGLVGRGTSLRQAKSRGIGNLARQRLAPYAVLPGRIRGGAENAEKRGFRPF